jgi:hypothetical protein
MAHDDQVDVARTAQAVASRLAVMIGRTQFLVRRLENSQTIDKDTVVSNLRLIEQIGRQATQEVRRLQGLPDDRKQ